MPLVVSLLVIGAISFLLQISVIAHPESVNAWVSSMGPLFIVGYVLIQAAAIIIPPIPGAIVRLPLLAILGPMKGLILIYLVTVPAECINFILAKKYGRPIVKKLVGNNAMERVDHYTKDAGLGTLVVLKLLEDSFFDYISYGLGLTSIPVKQFVLVNFTVGIPVIILDYFILTRAPNFTSSIILLEVSTGLITAGFVAYKHWQHKRGLSATRT